MKCPSALDAYVRAAVAHGTATVQGDHEGANTAHEAIMTALDDMRTEVAEWPSMLAEALGHPDMSVRCWAATHLLEKSPVTACRVLRELAERKGIIAFNARMVLREWQEGRLKPT